MFRLGFLTVEEFWTLSNACSNGCLVDLKYINEDKINYIKDILIRPYQNSITFKMTKISI